MAKVLLVDDHPDLREVVEQLLHIHGHEVHCTIDGESALQFLTGHHVDVAIIDQRLPGLSGIELLKKIHQNPAWSSVRVIMYSADDSHRQQAIQSGAADFWLKGSDRLFEAVAQLGATLDSQ